MLTTACEQAPKFPKEIKIYVPFFEFQTCTEFDVISTDPLRIEPSGNNFPIEHCDRIFGLTPEHQIKFNEWLEDTKEFFKEKCTRN